MKSDRFASSPFLSTLICFAVSFALTMGNSLHGQTPDTRIESTAHLDDKMLQGLQYRMIGPHRGGRSTAVAGVPGDHRTFYMGATGGGVWKTTDAGEGWANIYDRHFNNGVVG